MILVFGGTTEGKKTAALLESMRLPFVYSTKTNIAFETNDIVSYRYGALDEQQLEKYILGHDITMIVNASHPFAELLHSTIAKVAESLQIPVFRFGRQLLPKTANPLVFYVKTYEEALDLLEENKTLLALTGVQSIKRLTPRWKKNTTYFRILNRPESLAIARQSNFPRKQLILGFPSNDLEKEIDLIKTYQVDVVLTKETGNSGFLSTKIEVALKTDTSIIIIEQPKIPEYFIVVYDADTLELLISKTIVV
ncbi:precorrin-6A/cobalt-precorrin-6A reductase [Aquimarina algicola]|uniref:Precorrin-6A/cobalt-precorrin-6A reductase n=1 Tax=Aquimarina algicola TaxID=2589995 RepID=A0A504J864_9FLAO|nr:precorrin-6A/cobalt-precorrin-6A reductase [Aquimarina algicola]TPN87037.1 precorrin-6A/cobalt-precorrin-6A reductase [Aquimarina algicola]